MITQEQLAKTSSKGMPYLNNMFMPGYTDNPMQALADWYKMAEGISGKSRSDWVKAISDGAGPWGAMAPAAPLAAFNPAAITPQQAATQAKAASTVPLDSRGQPMGFYKGKGWYDPYTGKYSGGGAELTNPMTPGNGPLDPSNYSEAFGGIPNLPTLGTSAATAIGTNLRNMPQLQQTVSAVNPQYATQQDIIGEQLQGVVPRDVTAQLQQQMAERGVGTGTQMSPAAMSAYLARFLGTSYGIQQQGMAGANTLAGQAQGIMSPYMVNPAQQQELDSTRAIYKSAAIPARAAEAGRDAVQTASDRYMNMLKEILKPQTQTPAPLNVGNLNPGLMPNYRDLNLQPQNQNYGGGGGGYMYPQQQPETREQAIARLGYDPLHPPSNSSGEGYYQGPLSSDAYAKNLFYNQLTPDQRFEHEVMYGDDWKTAPGYTVPPDPWQNLNT